MLARASSAHSHRSAVLLLSVWTLATGVAQAATPTAQYEARFDATWSALTHPIDFPVDAHWSTLIGGTHDATASFWSPGTLASVGIKDMAERGRTTPLDTEVQAAIATSHAGVVILGGNTSTSPATATATFIITQQFPLATLVTMVAPSPDWFVGVHGLPLFVAGDWVNLIEVPLFAYDAGTDSGTSFASANLVTSPAEPIAVSDAAPFLNGVQMGTLTFTRIDLPNPTPVPVLSARGLAVTCLALAGLGVLLVIRRRAAERA